MSGPKVHSLQLERLGQAWDGWGMARTYRAYPTVGGAYTQAALKVEGNRRSGNVLKLEVHILQRLANCPIFANVLQAGKKEYYSYVVMTLLGASLDTLIGTKSKNPRKQTPANSRVGNLSRLAHRRGRHGRICTVSTQVRVGINALYGIKALHDMGFIHRDIKPANMALGTFDRSRIIHIFDFGLARQYVIFPKNGRPKGTLRYCSINAQERGEQGRPDDLWNLLYMLAEMRGKTSVGSFRLDTKNPFNRFSDPYDWEFEQSLQSFQDESKLKRIVTSPDGTPVTRSVSGTPASMSRGAVGRFPPTMRH
ncbi:hypothetical protein OSTOST_25017, partial [Ostertagia ostertagi]